MQMGNPFMGLPIFRNSENKLPKFTDKRSYSYFYECDRDCRKGLLGKIKPYGFTLFAKRYGKAAFLDCLERNEKQGIVYHRQGIVGDYDDFDDVEKLIDFIRTGKK